MVRIVARHFVAGLIFDRAGRCTQAAPILRWAEGKRLDWLRAYCARKGWGWEPIP